MRSTVLLSTLLLVLAGSVASAAELPEARPKAAGMSAERLDRITALGERYVAEGKLASVVTMVNRGGRIVHHNAVGTMGADDPRPVGEDAIFRLYSMTKPIAAVAALILYEEGAFQLRDPITKFLPEMANLQVWTPDGPVPVASVPTMQQLMTHTAGFGYVFTQHPVDEAYRQAQLFGSADLDAFVAKVAAIPLIDQPGARWHYSVSSTLLGAIVERISGMPFGDFLQQRLLDPLDMRDTGFNVPDADLDRVVTNHYWDAEKQVLNAIPADAPLSLGPTGNTLQAGGTGLFGTIRDYMRFAEMLRAGGSLGDVRILSPKTVEFMTSNHLFAPGGGTGEAPALRLGALYSGGFGFGLGVSVVTSPVEVGVIGSAGEFGWGGAAGTIFWVDPEEDMVVVAMIQLMRSPWPLRNELRVLSNAALTELAPR
ncbi:MAG TPA: serine hydrolase domain-containing protein [Pseudomonadales bacterium]|nr:serine hydrolase domain-containing protein [Pseudomonadales bacterium]